MSNQELNELYQKQSNRWQTLNRKLFGVGSIKTLDEDVDKYWNNGTCIMKEWMNLEMLIPNSWKADIYNGVLWLYASFYGRGNKRVAAFPIPTELGYQIKNVEYALRIKAEPNIWLLRKKHGIVRTRKWSYNPSKNKYPTFNDINEHNYPWLSAILGEQVNENNYLKALELMPEFDKDSVVYFNFNWFDEVERAFKKASKADPIQGKPYIFYSQLKRQNQYAKKQQITTNLLIVKNKLEALTVTREVGYTQKLKGTDYVPPFKFNDGQQLFDAYKTPTTHLAGRIRLLLDDVFVEDGILKADIDGKIYTQYDLAIDGERENLSAISKSKYNYLNDAKRIMLVSKHRAQASSVLGEDNNWTHEIPARVVFADFKGFSFGDSFVISKSFAKKLETTIEKTFVVPRLVAEQYREGTLLDEADLVKFDKKNRFSGWRDPEIVEIWNREIVVKARIPIGIGDKISNLHGSKGVISLILPDDQMPQLINDLSHAMPAGPIDIIIPGISVFDRKSIGQVFEAVTTALDIPEMSLDELKKNYFNDLKNFDERSVFILDGNKFKAPCGINSFIRLEHDSYTKQSFAGFKTNHNFNLHLAEMELLNLIARGYYNILNETDVRSLNKHHDPFEKIKKLQETGEIEDLPISYAKLQSYLRFLGWDMGANEEVNNTFIITNDEVNLWDDDKEKDED